MILEALNYAATYPLTSAEHRRAIRYSVNLQARASRCAVHWAQHEANTKAAILDAARRCRQRRTAVVLGSGLLRDVPIRVLRSLFDTVVLIDLVHLASVRAGLWLKRSGQVRLIERDLSGLQQLRAGEPVEPLGFLRQVPYLDLVVSANLLSQIVTGSRRTLAAEMAEADIDAMLAELVKAHLDGIRGIAAETCLISDIHYRVIDRNGRVHEDVDMLAGVALLTPRAEWDWPVVPFGEESPDYQVVHRVNVI